MYKVIEKEFIYKGIACFITLDKRGVRCGYVALPQDIYVNCDVDALECHGGITYVGQYLPGIEKEAGDKYYLGFDCAHTGDGRDEAAAKEAFGECDKDFCKGEIRTAEFCERELIRIVEQVRA